MYFKSKEFHFLIDGAVWLKSIFPVIIYRLNKPLKYIFAAALAFVRQWHYSFRLNIKTYIYYFLINCVKKSTVNMSTSINYLKQTFSNRNNIVTINS